MTSQSEIDAVHAAYRARKESEADESKCILEVVHDTVRAYEREIWDDIENAPLGVEILIDTVGGAFSPAVIVLNERTRTELAAVSQAAALKMKDRSLGPTMMMRNARRIVWKPIGERLSK